MPALRGHAFRNGSIPQTFATEFLDRLHAEGRLKYPNTRQNFALPNPDDAPFIALARYAGCPVVSGNLRRCPPETGVAALTPAAFLARHEK